MGMIQVTVDFTEDELKEMFKSPDAFQRAIWSAASLISDSLKFELVNQSFEEQNNLYEEAQKHCPHWTYCTDECTKCSMTERMREDG